MMDVDPWVTALAAYLLQPFVVQIFMLNRPLALRLLGSVISLASLYITATWVTRSIEYDPLIGLVFAPHGFLVARILNLLVDSNAATAFGLSSFWRVIAFTLLPATVVFTGAMKGELPNTRRRGLEILGRGVVQQVALVIIALGITKKDILQYLPAKAHVALYLIMILLASGAAADIVFNAPTRLIVGSSAVVIDTSEVPFQMKSVANFWQRHSKSVSFHLKRSVYNPLGGKQKMVVASIATFLVSAFIHVYWWSMMITGRIGYEYFTLLLVPGVFIVVESKLLQLLGLSPSEGIVRWTRFLAARILGSALLPLFLSAAGLPEKPYGYAKMVLGG